MPFIARRLPRVKHLNVKLNRAKLEAAGKTWWPAGLNVPAGRAQGCRQNRTRLTSHSVWRHDPLPNSGTVKNFFGREPHRGGTRMKSWPSAAAIQAGVLAGDVKDVLLLDVTPLIAGYRDVWVVCFTPPDRRATRRSRQEGPVCSSRREDNQGA